MADNFQATFSKEGRILIPKAVRKLLDIKAGDQMILKIVNQELVISPKKNYLGNLQKELATKAKDKSLVDDLKAMRQSDAQQD